MTKRVPLAATFRADLTAIYDALRPATIGCSSGGEVSFLPLEAFVRGGARIWFIDAHAGRVQSRLESLLLREVEGQQVCLACDPALTGKDVCSAYVARTVDGVPSCVRLESARDARCVQFVPGRSLQIVNGDGGRGRGAGFATRVEAVVAGASSVAGAVEAAVAICERSAQMNVPLPIADGSLDLAISVLAPARLMEQPYAYFDGLMRRRFGNWTARASRSLVRGLDALRIALFRIQLDAHISELSRLVTPQLGRLYFATVPVEARGDGSWPLEEGVGECFDALARAFVFDFDTFPAEAFLRRPASDPSVVIQAALLRLKPRAGEGS